MKGFFQRILAVLRFFVFQISQPRLVLGLKGGYVFAHEKIDFAEVELRKKG